ncbi:amidohydrolase family protein [Streptomyces sp. NBC_00481]|uniref:amidohydrolase family protein n=1 Tax=Streptomyces sp. NBC_00481 TaxID=2975755 RepID=UPI002DDAABEB|nr:amidohydrolase family protein [Streptomyces sp. NBC_00481]WRZ00429.1 amidohydrolase family protein [Streptomyces sp. NBC_00481]
MPTGNTDLTRAVTDLARTVHTVPLVDHHVHGAFSVPISRVRFEESINEGSPEPIPPWMTQFDSQLGFAIRAHCAPLLDLEPHAPADEYWAARERLGEAEVTRRFTRAAGVGDWVVDTGYLGGEILSPPQLAEASGGRAHEIVRLETVAETIAAEGTTSGPAYADAFRARLAAAVAGTTKDPPAVTVVGVKTVVAYRCGFDIDWTPPTPGEVAAAATRWLARPGPAPRLADPTLLRFGIYAATELGLPIQFHTGFGDRDLDLHRVNPMLLLGLLRQPTIAQVPIMLLHCYPYHREAGYLAQAFTNVYCDVGLALHHVGVRADAVLAESLELAPFAKVLYASDACGPAELHYLGALLWRRAVARTLGGWVAEGAWSAPDAVRVIDLMGAGNARRVYGLERGE